MVNLDIKARMAELEKDQYVKQWISGLSPRTKDNYLRGILYWNDFLGMTPTEQINKRMKDLTSQDLTERTFFEAKFREYKAMRENQGKLSALSIKSELRTVASFFGRTVGRLALRRGDWNSTLSTRIKNKLTLELKDVKAMYAHGNLRDRVLLLVLAQSGFSEVDVSEFKIEDMKGIYETPISTHYFIEKAREKTGEIQATALSFECIHDLRDLLSERGNPKEGFLFTSQTKKKGKEGIEVRRIHEAMKNLAEKSLSEEKAQGFKTKMLRSLYNSALLRADIKQEVKDLLMGHQRLGARGAYGYDSITIIEAYSKAFEFMSINGMQSREDLANIKESMKQQKDFFTQLITELKTRNDKLENALTALGQDVSSIKKTVGNQDLDILELQTKTKTKPKPIRDTGS